MYMKVEKLLLSCIRCTDCRRCQLGDRADNVFSPEGRGYKSKDPVEHTDTINNTTVDGNNKRHFLASIHEQIKHKDLRVVTPNDLHQALR